MKLLIGADGEHLQNMVSKRFGHAANFIEYDTDTKQFRADANNQEEHNHDNLYGYLEEGVEAFIVGNIGPHAFEIANSPTSKVYLARKMTVQQAIDSFLKGDLEQLTEPTAKRSIGHR